MPNFVKGVLHVLDNNFRSSKLEPFTLWGLKLEPFTHTLVTDIHVRRNIVHQLALMRLYLDEEHLNGRRFERYQAESLAHQVPLLCGNTGGHCSTSAFTASIEDDKLKVTVLSAGSLFVGQIIKGPGVMDGTHITGFATATGGVGSYYIQPCQNVARTTMTSNDLRYLLLDQFIDWIHENTAHRWSFEVEYAHMSNVNFIFSFENKAEATHFALMWR